MDENPEPFFSQSASILASSRPPICVSIGAESEVWGVCMAISQIGSRRRSSSRLISQISSKISRA
jgi:hypothetical protein